MLFMEHSWIKLLISYLKFKCNSVSSSILTLIKSNNDVLVNLILSFSHENNQVQGNGRNVHLLKLIYFKAQSRCQCILNTQGSFD